MTEEEKKAAALAEVKSVAEKAVTDKMADLLKSELSSEQAKEAITNIVNEAIKSAKVADPIDGVEKTLADLVKEMQAQHDALVAAVEKKNTSTKGSVPAFVEKNITERKSDMEGGNYRAKTTFKAIDLVREASKAPALMTTANVIGVGTNGLSPLFGTYVDTEIGHIPRPENIVLGLVRVTNQPGTENIVYTDRINEEGNAQFIAEGALKPLADAEYSSQKAVVKEVAVRWKFTKRLMFHAPSVVADFAEHAYLLMDDAIDLGLLTGDNIGNNLKGLTTAASAFIVPTELANFYPDANIFDAVNAMAARIRLSNFRGRLTVVLNTVWKAKFMGYKDAENRYLVPPFVTPDGTRIADVEVRFTNRMDGDDILIGDLSKFNVVFAENIMYDEGYENDDFSKNLVSKKLEAFLGTYIKVSDAGSILFDSIASVLDDIDKSTPVT